MTAHNVITHIRSELALHRFDLVGLDEQSESLLAHPELTSHAVAALNNFDVIAERSVERTRRSGARDLDVRLRVESQHDVQITINAGRCRLALVEPDDVPALSTTAPDRLLMLWGRRPAPGRTTNRGIDTPSLHALDRWLFA